MLLAESMINIWYHCGFKRGMQGTPL